MISRAEIFSYIKAKYKTEPDYPWTKNPNYAVLRHNEKKNNKWYGLIMNVPKTKLGLNDTEHVEIINVKCEPELIYFLRGQEGIFPAYHMNKEHWVTISLDSNFPKEEILKLIDNSFELTK